MSQLISGAFRVLESDLAKQSNIKRIWQESAAYFGLNVEFDRLDVTNVDESILRNWPKPLWISFQLASNSSCSMDGFLNSCRCC